MLPGPCTSTGTSERPVVVLMPSLPKPPLPHVQTVPSDLRMMVPRAPPQMETTSAERATRGMAKANVATAPIPAQDAFAFSQAFMFPWRIANAVAGYSPTAACERVGKQWTLATGFKLKWAGRTSVFCWPAIERMQRIHRLIENKE